MEPREHRLEARQRIIEVEVKFRRDPTDPPFDFPDRFSVPTLFPKDGHVIRINLGIVTEDEAEQSRFSRAVRAQQSPAFTATNGPGDPIDKHRRSVAHRDISQPDQDMSICLWRCLLRSRWRQTSPRML